MQTALSSAWTPTMMNKRKNEKERLSKSEWEAKCLHLPNPSITGRMQHMVNLKMNSDFPSTLVALSQL